MAPDPIQTYNNLTTFFTTIANAIRRRLGTTAKITPNYFPVMIDEVYQKGYDDAPKGVDVSDTTATAPDVLQNKTFYGADGENKKGTMPQKTSVNGMYDVYIQGQIPRVAFKITENGYVTSNSSTVVPAANLFNGISLTADKILKGKNILHLNGTATSDATAKAADIAIGKTAYVDGVKLTGTAPDIETGSFSVPEITPVEGYTIDVAQQPQEMIIYTRTPSAVSTTNKIVYNFNWNINKGYFINGSAQSSGYLSLDMLATYSNGVVTLSDPSKPSGTRYFYANVEYGYIVVY